MSQFLSSLKTPLLHATLRLFRPYLLPMNYSSSLLDFGIRDSSRAPSRTDSPGPSSEPGSGGVSLARIPNSALYIGDILAFGQKRGDGCTKVSQQGRMLQNAPKVATTSKKSPTVGVPLRLSLRFNFVKAAFCTNANMSHD